MKYLYYKLWLAFKRIKTNDMPATNALIFLTLWQFLNLALIYIILGYSFNVKIELNSKKEIYLFAGVLYSILTLMNYFFLYKKRKEIHEKNKNESKNQRIVGNILLVIYILGSFALVIFFGTKYTASF